MLWTVYFLSCLHPKIAPTETVQYSGVNGKIGVQYRRVDDMMYVIKVIPNMPAADAGIETGDLLVSVEGRSIFNGSENRIAGPPNTEVKIELRHPLEAKLSSITLIRSDHSPTKVLSTEAKQARQFINMPNDEKEELIKAIALEGEEVYSKFWTALIKDRGFLQSIRSLDPEIYVPFIPSVEHQEYIQTRLSKINIESVEGAKWSEERVINYTSLDGETMDLGGWPIQEWRSLLAEWEAKSDKSDVLLRLRHLNKAHSLSPTLLSAFGMAPLVPIDEWTVNASSFAQQSLELIDGGQVSLKDEQQLTVLNFWATWCGPCRREMPEFVELSKRLEGESVRFIGISTDKAAQTEAVHQMVGDWEVPFPVSINPGLQNPFRVSGIPAIRVINKEGQLIIARQGYSPTAMTELEAEILGALENDKPLEETIAFTLSESEFSLSQFIPVSGVRAFEYDGEGLWVSRRDQAPTRIRLNQPRVNLSEVSDQNFHPSDLIVVGKGPIVANVGEHLIRAYNPDGQSHWVESTPSPITDMIRHNDLLYVSTETDLLIFDLEGKLQNKEGVEITDLSSGLDHIYALSQTGLFRIEKYELKKLEIRPNAAMVNSLGGVSSSLFKQSLIMRHEEKEIPVFYRPARAKQPAAVVVMGEGGKPPNYLFLSEDKHSIGVWDIDEDGNDELIISYPETGIAMFRVH